MRYILLYALLLWLPSIFFNQPDTTGFFYWRHQLTLLTGLIALTAMGLAMLLAMRFSWVDKRLNGLDKSYKLHKTLGITALVAVICHWVLIELPKWLIPLGLMERPNRQHHGGQISNAIDWTHLAKEVGNFTFYVFVIFCAISLIQRFTYKQFQWTHKLAGAIFLASAFHSVLLVEWEIPSWLLSISVVVTAIVGSIFALRSLTFSIGKDKKYQGSITQANVVAKHPSLLHLQVAVEHPMNAKAGQFVFLSFDDNELPHPFSILSKTADNRHFEFAIKSLGDYTNQLPKSLRIGSTITLEGPYGEFTLPNTAHQVWLAAGVGAVPILSWLQQVKEKGLPQGTDKVHIAYCYRDPNDDFLLNKFRALTKDLANVELHLFVSGEGQRLTAADIAEWTALPTTHVYFCGPEAFSIQLKQQLVELGLVPSHFHCENFRIR